MAVLKGNPLECKKYIKEVLRKIDEGKYKIDFIVMKAGIEETEPIKDKNGSLCRNYKRSYHDTFTINYIDEEAKESII